MPKANSLNHVFTKIDMSAGPDACWPWQGGTGGVSRKMRTGGAAATSKERPYFHYHGRKLTATRVVYELVNGVTLSHLDVIRHKCDNSLCCNPAHMEVGTHFDNMQDMVERDRHGLPHHVVRRIRVLLARGGKTHREIADLYGVDRSIVTRIANNQAHTHAQDYPTEDDHQRA